MGNLNVGKSAILSRLTGLRIAVSDCPGATVAFTQGSGLGIEPDTDVVDTRTARIG